MAISNRFQPATAGASPDEAFKQLADVVDQLALSPAFAPSTASPIQVGVGQFRRIAPRAGTQQVVIPRASADTYGKTITLLVENSLGAVRVRAVSGTINGSAAFSLAAGYTTLIELVSNGDGKWVTTRAAGFPVAGTGLLYTGETLALAPAAANTLKGNPTAASAIPIDIALQVQSILLRAAGNITNPLCSADQALQRVGSGDLGFAATRRLLRAPQVLTATNAAFVHPADMRLLVVFMVGGGGGGGGATATAGSGGNGGNAGNWALKTFTAISGNSNITIGGAGTTTAGAAGGNGGDSSCVHNAVTLTVRGGTGGNVLAGAATVAAAAQNAGNAADAGADLSQPGQSGGEAWRNAAAATAIIGGLGGSGPMGQGGQLQGGVNAAGRAAFGRGSGGGGALNPSGAATLAGGTPTAGACMLWEFS